jgi:hypothetical protein
VVLDATAGLDPRYLLVSGPEIERVPDASFPNAVIVSTSSTTVTKTALEKTKATPSTLSSEIVAAVKPYRHHINSLLVVTHKKMESKIEKGVDGAITDGSLPKKTVVQHFGNLRGKNEFRDFDAVYFSHLHRYKEPFYVGLTYLLEPFEKFPGKWEPKKHKAWERPALIARAMVSDLYQDAMRIGLRSDPKRRAFIFVPTEESEFIVRLMRLFPGAQFVGHGATPALIEDAPSLPPATAVAPSPVAGRIIEPAYRQARARSTIPSGQRGTKGPRRTQRKLRPASSWSRTTSRRKCCM